MSVNIRKQLGVIIMKTLYVKTWNVAKGYLEGILYPKMLRLGKSKLRINELRIHFNQL